MTVNEAKIGKLTTIVYNSYNSTLGHVTRNNDVWYFQAWKQNTQQEASRLRNFQIIINDDFFIMVKPNPKRAWFGKISIQT